MYSAIDRLKKKNKQENPNFTYCYSQLINFMRVGTIFYGSFCHKISINYKLYKKTEKIKWVFLESLISRNF
jgi:hypothetical protein